MGHRSRKEHVRFSSSLRAGSMLLHPSHGLQNVKNCFNLWSCQSVTPTGAEVLGTSSISLLGIAIGGRRAFTGCCWGAGIQGEVQQDPPQKSMGNRRERGQIWTHSSTSHWWQSPGTMRKRKQQRRPKRITAWAEDAFLLWPLRYHLCFSSSSSAQQGSHLPFRLVSTINEGRAHLSNL